MKLNRILLTTCVVCSVLTGCLGGGNSQNTPASGQESTAYDNAAAENTINNTETEKQGLSDGEYTVDFNTDSSMFGVSEACNGKGTLTVTGTEMTIHVSLKSKKIVKLYCGTAEEAKAASDGDTRLLNPTTDSVTYSDGITEEVYGYDIPVSQLDTEFDLAILGTKGTWYDHKVSVASPEADGENSTENGEYTIAFDFEGGSGKASIISPAKVIISDEGMTAVLEWNSPNYDYMIVDGQKYLPVNTEGNSVFEIPLTVMDEPLTVIGDTVAMSKPHEIEYTVTFHSDTLTRTEDIQKKTDNTIENTTDRLVYEGSMKLSYARNFTVDYYKEGYRIIKTKDGTQLLVVPEGKEVPAGIAEDMVIIKQPLSNIYVVSTAVMDIFNKLEALDSVGFSSQKADGWYIKEAREAVENGSIIYAGKYNKPDYELLVSKKCTIAIENMMISHSTEVMEMLENFDIPVIIEYSSYESHPLARVEWIKFFGVLTGKEELAEDIFNKQVEIVEKVTQDKKTDKTVAYFYVTSNGLIQVRSSNDYIPKMIELAGGKYIFDNIGDDSSARSTMNMQVEEFYAGAKDADYIIYNSTIDGEIKTIDELIDKCSILGDFKAVKNKNVWCTSNDMYQQSMSIGDMINDIHIMLTSGDASEMKYLFRLK